MCIAACVWRHYKNHASRKRQNNEFKAMANLQQKKLPFHWGQCWNLLFAGLIQSHKTRDLPHSNKCLQRLLLSLTSQLVVFSSGRSRIFSANNAIRSSAVAYTVHAPKHPFCWSAVWSGFLFHLHTNHHPLDSVTFRLVMVMWWYRWSIPH